jgi:hypothetical protein
MTADLASGQARSAASRGGGQRGFLGEGPLMAENGWFRLVRMSRSGKYALCHLLASSLALLLGLGIPAEHAVVPWMILGFPLMYLQWLFPDLPKQWPPALGLLLLLGLMVVNSYLWGHAAALAHGLVERKLTRRSANNQTP